VGTCVELAHDGPNLPAYGQDGLWGKSRPYWSRYREAVDNAELDFIFRLTHKLAAYPPCSG